MKADLRSAVPRFQDVQQARAVPGRMEEVDKIHVVPGLNPRGYATGEAAFQGESFEDLKASIREVGGVLQPLLLRPHPEKPGQFQLVAGERRLRAVTELGMGKVAVEVHDMTDEQMYRYCRAENDLREAVKDIDRKLSSLNLLAAMAGVAPGGLRTLLVRLRNHRDQDWPEDSAEARLLDAKARLLPKESISTLVRSWSRYLDLSDLEVQAMRDGTREGVILPLLDLPKGDVRDELLRRALAEEWTAEQMELAVRPLRGGPVAAEGLVRASQSLRRSLSPAKLASLSGEQQQQLQADLDALRVKYFGK